MLYNIKEGDTIVSAEPIVGRWYCHFEVVTLLPAHGRHHRSGMIAEYQGNGFWIGEDDEPVESMVSEYWPDYLVLQD
jgi:hypothetical protein